MRYSRFTVGRVGAAGVRLLLAVVQDGDCVLHEGPGHRIFDELEKAASATICAQYGSRAYRLILGERLEARLIVVLQERARELLAVLV